MLDKGTVAMMMANAGKRLRSWAERIGRQVRVRRAMGVGNVRTAFGPSYAMLIFAVVAVSPESIAQGVEPEIDCNQFVTDVKTLGADFKPEWLTPEMEQWDGERQYREAWNHYSMKYIKDERGKALYWFCRSAVSGYSHAEHKIASLYREGIEVPKDSATAFKWMLRAANAGSWRAQSSVWAMYSSGEGTEKNEIEARKWEDIVKKRWLRTFDTIRKTKDILDTDR